jgi:hypothetical protein
LTSAVVVVVEEVLHRDDLAIAVCATTTTAKPSAPVDEHAVVTKPSTVASGDRRVGDTDAPREAGSLMT